MASWTSEKRKSIVAVEYAPILGEDTEDGAGRDRRVSKRVTTAGTRYSWLLGLATL
jgi:hypothetical protein